VKVRRNRTAKTLRLSLAALAAAGALVAVASGMVDQPWWRVGPVRDDRVPFLLVHSPVVFYPTEYTTWYQQNYYPFTDPRYPYVYPSYYNAGGVYGYGYYGYGAGGTTFVDNSIYIDNSVVVNASDGGVIQDVFVDQEPDTTAVP